MDAPDAAPVYRLASPWNGDHFFTLSAGEKEYAEAIGYRFEATVGFAFPGPGPGRTALFRAVNPVTGQHLYLTDADHFLGLQAPWVREGVAGYVLK